MTQQIFLFSLLTLLHSITLTSSLPVTYLSPPTPLWNQAIRTTPSQTNQIAISPDHTWLYVTSVDYGTLSKLHPENGNFVRYYDTLGVEAEEGGRFVYGQGGIEFFVANNDDDETTAAVVDEESGGNYLLYWVLDVSQQGYFSKVVCVEHDDSEEIVVRWVVSLSGILSGMPKIGSDGKLIYLTINADSDTPISSNADSSTNTNNSDGGDDGVSPSDVPPPTSDSTIEIDTDTVDATTLDPTPYWYLNTGLNDTLICDYGIEYSDDMTVNGTSVDTTLFETQDDCCAVQPNACEDVPSSDGGGSSNSTVIDENATTTTGEPTDANSSESEATTTDVPNEAPEGENTRKLQTSNKSGRFIILNAENGNIVYSFDSQSDFTIRNHKFGPTGIANRPTYGNYAGGEDNTNDVLMWGSASGSSTNSGETLLFQLPKGFDSTSLLSSSTVSLVDQFETRVMESVPWTTDAPPTFSKDGLAVYFLISGNRLTGWNNGRKFDIASNVGPVDLSTAVTGGGSVQRPMVLADDDKTLLVGVQDVMYGVDVSSTPASIGWQLDAFGGGASFTTPQITPDGKMAYFGKSGAMHAINLNAGGALLWEATSGYVDPFKAMSQITMADFSLDSSGQILYYCHGGSDTITALRIGEEIPTDSPTQSPSGRPSVTSSISPSTSTAPTLSMAPTYGKDYIYPSASPTETLSGAPSTSPTVKPTISPTQSPYPSTMTGVASQPEFVDAGSPTLDTPTTSSTNNTAVLAGDSNPTSPASSKDDESTSTLPFSMPVIIGIGVGGGVGLILILGLVCYLCRKKPCSGGGEDDGVDTDWQSSDEAKQHMQFSGGGGGGEGQPHFQYSYGDEESDHRYGGEPLKW